MSKFGPCLPLNCTRGQAEVWVAGYSLQPESPPPPRQLISLKDHNILFAQMKKYMFYIYKYVYVCM